jgi:protein involved in polysaccharide export with SLBB domain
MNSYTRTSSSARREPMFLAAARVCAVSSLVVAVVASPAVAQSSATDGESRRPPTAASRVQLDSLAARTEAAVDSSATEERRLALRRYAVELRARLRNGDFQAGDRIVVVTRGDSTSVDTLTVQSDRTVTLQKLPPIALDGVLRSELPNYLAQQLHQYVKRDLVSATPLVRVGVLGEVVHPGYYRVPLQITLGDLLMVAGGPSPQADLTRVRVRRGQSTIIDEPNIRDAMVRGLPLSELGIDAGDEILLRAPPQRNWGLIAQLVGVATGIALTLHTFKVF